MRWAKQTIPDVVFPRRTLSWWIVRRQSSRWIWLGYHSDEVLPSGLWSWESRQNSLRSVNSHKRNNTRNFENERIRAVQCRRSSHPGAILSGVPVSFLAQTDRPILRILMDLIINKRLIENRVVTFTIMPSQKKREAEDECFLFHCSSIFSFTVFRFFKMSVCRWRSIFWSPSMKVGCSASSLKVRDAWQTGRHTHTQREREKKEKKRERERRERKRRNKEQKQ